MSNAYLRLNGTLNASLMAEYMSYMEGSEHLVKNAERKSRTEIQK
jgi:hypothetical protein